jgi:sugar diacid utilization regulator
MLSIRDIIRPYLDSIPVCMATGGYCEKIERISAGYMEAWETIDIGKKLFRSDFATSYEEMTPYHLAKRFLTTTGRPELFEEVYKPLLQYDREKGGELAHTLETYIECNFSHTRTANILHIHRNSLNYRLQKIEDLLDQDIDRLDAFPFLVASISRRLSS